MKKFSFLFILAVFMLAACKEYVLIPPLYREITVI